MFLFYRLGIILGSKIYINFAKYSFEEAARKLINEVKSFVGTNDENNDVDKSESGRNKLFNPTIITPIRSNKIDTWTNEDVHNWLENSNINNKIKNELKDFDGKLLRRLKTIKNESPDYFYKSISQNNNIDLLSIVYFTEQFETLF